MHSRCPSSCLMCSWELEFLLSRILHCNTEVFLFYGILLVDSWDSCLCPWSPFQKVFACVYILNIKKKTKTFLGDNL